MTPEPHLQVLRRIVLTLQNEPIQWVVTGSLGMALHGVPLDVHDIDIQTDRTGAAGIERILNEYSTSPVKFRESERIRSYFGTFEIDGVKVEIMGELQKRLADGTWEEPVKVETFREWLAFDGLEVPVMSLEYEVQAYYRMGRNERADMLRAWLDKST